MQLGSGHPRRYRVRRDENIKFFACRGIDSQPGSNQGIGGEPGCGGMWRFSSGLGRSGSSRKTLIKGPGCTVYQADMKSLKKSTMRESNGVCLLHNEPQLFKVLAAGLDRDRTSHKVAELTISKITRPPYWPWPMKMQYSACDSKRSHIAHVASTLLNFCCISENEGTSH
jgi:hypothetical protein